MSGQGQAPIQAPVQEQVEGRVYYDAQGRAQGQVALKVPILVSREDERSVQLGLDFWRYQGDFEELAEAHGLEGANCLALYRAVKRVEE